MVALASIVYYKVVSAPPAKKKKTAAAQGASKAPMLLKGDLLGRAHPNGVLLTRSFFRTGDLILVKRSGRWAAAMILKEKGAVTTKEAGAPPLPLMPWLKAAGGRFALVRVDRRDPAKLKTLVSLATASTKGGDPRQRNKGLLELYKKAGFRFPAPATPGKEPLQAQLEFLTKRSNFNDFRN